MGLAGLLLFTTACRENVRDADVLYAQGNYGRAAERYRDFIKENPKSRSLPDAYIGVAWSEYQQGNYIEATEAVGVLRGRFPGSRLEPTAIYIHGLTLFAERRYVEASNELRELALNYPHDPITPEARFLLARSEAALLRYAAAAEDYGAYLEKYASGPYAAAALLGRAEAFSRIARWKDAADVLEVFVRKFADHPDHPRAMIDLSRHLEAIGEYERAEKLLHEFRRRYTVPELEREAMVRLAGIYGITRRGDEAAEIRRKLFDLLPLDADTDRADIAFALAEHYVLRGDTDAAVHFFTRIRDRYSHNAIAHARALEWLAYYERGRGQREAALSMAQEFLASYSNDPRADDLSRMLINIYIEAGRLREAHDRLIGLIRKNYSSAEPRDFYGVATLGVQLRDYESALEWGTEGLKRAERMGDSRAIVSGLYHSMIINNLEGDLPAVVKAWWRLKEMSPNYLTVTERIFWDEQEDRMYRENRILPVRRDPTALLSPYIIAVHLNGFLWPAGDTLAMGVSASLMSLFATSVTIHSDMKFVPEKETKFVRELTRRVEYDRLPDSYFPLRSNVGADWIVYGDIRTERREPMNVVVTLKLLRIDYEGVFPFEYQYRFTPEEAVTAGPGIVREAIDKLRLLRPIR